MSLFWIYLITVIVLCIVYYVFYRHRKNITSTLIKQIDLLLFSYDTAIYKNTKNIYDYDSNKNLLFHNQITLFWKSKKYTDITPQIIQDIEYLSWLLQYDVVDPSIIKITKVTYITWQKINTLKEYTHIILSILTLWIAKLFI